jgi:hypothetical protein
VKVNIDIRQLDNGFLVEFMSDEGPSTMDKTFFFPKWKELIDGIQEWYKEINDVMEEENI